MYNCCLDTPFCTVTPPTALEEVSVSHVYKDLLEDFKDLTYLLCTDTDAITAVHTDFSNTSVFYHVVTGEKEFLVAERTENNIALYNSFKELEAADKKILFTHSMLEGKVARVTIQTGEAMFMAANTIHMVRTARPTIAIGVNFLHTSHLFGAALAYRQERMEAIPYTSCFPSFAKMGLTVLSDLAER